MAVAVTQKFEEMVLEIETAVPGTFTRICGLTDVEITRASNIDTVEIPDCDDESLPHSIEKQVRSIEVSVSASGVWAQQSWGVMSDWFYSGTTRNIRIRNTRASIGDLETEAGPALLASMNNSRTKGQKVTASVEFQFDGTPTRTDRVA